MVGRVTHFTGDFTGFNVKVDRRYPQPMLVLKIMSVVKYGGL